MSSKASRLCFGARMNALLLVCRVSHVWIPLCRTKAPTYQIDGSICADR
jgi:hypothetical protein